MKDIKYIENCLFYVSVIIKAQRIKKRNRFTIWGNRQIGHQYLIMGKVDKQNYFYFALVWTQTQWQAEWKKSKLKLKILEWVTMPLSILNVFKSHGPGDCSWTYQRFSRWDYGTAAGNLRNCGKQEWCWKTGSRQMLFWFSKWGGGSISQTRPMNLISIAGKFWLDLLNPFRKKKSQDC